MMKKTVTVEPTYIGGPVNYPENSTGGCGPWVFDCKFYPYGPPVMTDTEVEVLGKCHYEKADDENFYRRIQDEK